MAVWFPASFSNTLLCHCIDELLAGSEKEELDVEYGKNYERRYQ